MAGKTGCVKAGTLKPGDFFIKRQGTFAYLVVNNNSLFYVAVVDEDEFALDTAPIVGVSFNGNATKVKPGSLVRKATIADMIQNIEDQAKAGAPLGKIVRDVRELFIQERVLGPDDKQMFMEVPLDYGKKGDRMRVTVESCLAYGTGDGA